MEAVIADPEMVANLVENGATYLAAQPGRGEAHRQVRLPEDRDLVGHGAKVMVAPVGEHDAFVEAEQIAMLSADIFGALSDEQLAALTADQWAERAIADGVRLEQVYLADIDVLVDGHSVQNGGPIEFGHVLAGTPTSRHDA